MARGPITFSTRGNFSKTTAFLQRLQKVKILEILNRYGATGVAQLQAATPIDSGLTRSSWYYTTGAQNGSYWIDFHNNNMAEGIPIVILIQYGHGTRNGGYVAPRDFINPVIKPLFENIRADVWKVVSSA